MYIKTYELKPVRFLIAQRFSWQTMLKKTKVKLELLTDIDMLLIKEIGIRSGICHAIYRYGEANNKYMKNYEKKNHHI